MEGKTSAGRGDTQKGGQRGCMKRREEDELGDEESRRRETRGRQSKVNKRRKEARTRRVRRFAAFCREALRAE